MRLPRGAETISRVCATSVKMGGQPAEQRDRNRAPVLLQHPAADFQNIRRQIPPPAVVTVHFRAPRLDAVQELQFVARAQHCGEPPAGAPWSVSASLPPIMRARGST